MQVATGLSVLIPDRELFLKDFDRIAKVFDRFVRKAQSSLDVRETVKGTTPFQSSLFTCLNITESLQIVLA